MKIKTVSLWKCITTRRRNSIFSRVEEEEAGWPTKSLLAGFIVGGFHHIISSSLRNCEWRVLTPLWFFVQHCFLMAEWCRCFALITGGAVLLGSIPIPEGRFGWEIFILDKVELYFDPTDDIYEVENANSNTQDHHCFGLYIFLIVLMVVIIVSFHCSMRNYDGCFGRKAGHMRWNERIRCKAETWWILPKNLLHPSLWFLEQPLCQWLSTISREL